MTWLERLAYDLRHPITLIQRTAAQRYCKRFGLRMVEPPFVTLRGRDFEHVASVVPQRYQRSQA